MAADERITDLATLAGSSVADGDLFVIVDLSDLTMDPSGTDKGLSALELATVIANRIGGTVSAEAALRVSGDATNATAVTNEATTRATADTTETNARVAADALLIPLTQKAANSGVATLDNTGHVPAGQLPALVLSHTFVVGSQAAMLALSAANVGDLAVRTDVNETFILTSPDPSQLVNWTQLLFPGGGAVNSVNSRTGAVTGLAENTVTVTGGTGLTGGGDLSANRTISMPAVGAAGTYGDATHIVQVTTDAQGRVSGATAIAIAGLAESAVTNLVADLAAKANKTDNLSVFAATTSAQLRGVLSDETGTGAAVFANSPALTTPTGIVKGDVGLGSVDNVADASKAFAASQITSGVFAVARLATGTPTGSKFVRDDGTLQVPTAPTDPTLAILQRQQFK